MEMDLKKVKIGILGGGAMGEAIIRGILKAKLFTAQQVNVSDASEQRLKILKDTYKIKPYTDNKKLVADFGVIIIAVKPQVLPAVLKECASASDKAKLFLSIAAGVKSDAIAALLSGKCRVIRAMPNTAARVLESATALCSGPNATNDDMKAAEKIFAALGKTVLVEEKLMDAVTGLSGSGPAYVFLFLEALIDAGVKVGLTRAVASELAAQTIFGAAMLVKETQESATKLKEQVTSPGGTTISGLHVLEKGGFRGLVMDAVEAATNRSKELGK
jgi:pyrroline-5-carboxylate reductase